MASTALGSGVASGAGALGAPEGVQDVLQLGSELGYGLGKGRIPRVGTEQKKAYDTATALAGEASSKTAPIENALANIGKKLSKETTKKVSEEINHVAQVVEGNLDKLNGKLKVKDAIDLRRKLGESYDAVSRHAKPYVNELRDSFNQFFAEYGAENPQFFKALDKADKLTMMKHQQTIIDKFADLLVDKIPGAVGMTGKGLSKLILSPTIGKLEKLGRNIITNPEAQKHYLNFAKAAATQNTPLFINSLKKLDESLG